jgi:hypothetical protein
MTRLPTKPAAEKKKKIAKRPRLLIEEWLPAQAIGVECMRTGILKSDYPRDPTATPNVNSSQGNE